MRRIWPPEDDEIEYPLQPSDAAALRAMCVYLEVALHDEDHARAFAARYGLTFQRSGVTTRGSTAWITLQLGAADERDAALQSAVSIKFVTDSPLVGAPLGAKLHHADDAGPIPGYDELGVRALRDRLLSYAKAYERPDRRGRALSGTEKRPRAAIAARYERY